jgi:thiosulfate/3-mercaptopyruvate sulfurtransferase
VSYAHPAYLISAQELMQQLNDPAVRIYDTSVLLLAAEQGYTSQPGRERYLQEHIPGAGFINLSDDWSDTRSPYNNTLPQIDALAAAIGRDGISNDNLVVLYSSSHLMWATRAWWLLRYAGHTNVKVLNGNLAAWLDAGLPVESGTKAYAASTFSPSERADVFVSTVEMIAGMEDSVCTVNALSPALYEGTGEFYYGRRGHIPGSRSLYFSDLLENEFFLPAEQLHQILEARGMLSAPRTLIYCGGGIAATLEGFACTLVGQENVGVYDGSMSEWAANEELPLTLGSKP